MPLLEFPIVIIIAGSALIYNMYKSMTICLKHHIGHRETKNKYNKYAPVSKLLDKDLECTICLEEFSTYSTVRKLNCGHVYHKNCIDVWWKLKHDRCPNCNANFLQD
jgi:hypothetical protein